MAARIGHSLAILRKLDAAASETDARLVWKDGDEFNVGIIQPRERREDWDRYFVQQLSIASARELRLLGLQMIRHADNLECCEEFEVVLP